MKSNDTFLLGVIVKAQGIKGEVKVKAYTDTPDVLCDLEHVYIDGIQFDIRTCRTDRTMAYIGLAGINDRNSAEAMVKKELSIPRAEAPKLPEGHHYISDLVGCAVQDDNGVDLGKLTDIIQGGGNDVYVIRLRGKDMLVPVIKTVIVSIDIEKQQIVLSASRLKEVAVYDN